jgi:hypothetical protein
MMTNQTTFSQTQTFISFWKSQGDNWGIKRTEKGSMWVEFPNGTSAMISSKVMNDKGQVKIIDASNVRELQISYVDGVNEETGKPVKGWLVHNKGTAETVATMSLSDLAELAV